MLAVKRDPRGILASLVLFVAAFASGWWSIKQSRASTAGIGFLFLPLAATVSGFLALAFGRWRVVGDPAVKLIAWLALAGALTIVVLNISEGTHRNAANKSFDDAQNKFEAEIARDHDSVTAALKANPGRKRVWLDSAIRARMNDRAFLLAALPIDSVSSDLLDSLARRNDLNVSVAAVNNPNTRAETLVRVYHTATYPDYFLQPLAAHRNTPPEIMRELYRRPRAITGLDIWFAGNPSTPKDILVDIAGTTTDWDVANALLGNSAVDCPTLTVLAQNLMKKQNRSADNLYVRRFNEVYPVVCKSKSTSAEARP